MIVVLEEDFTIARFFPPLFYECSTMLLLLSAQRRVEGSCYISAQSNYTEDRFKEKKVRRDKWDRYMENPTISLKSIYIWKQQGVFVHEKEAPKS